MSQTRPLGAAHVSAVVVGAIVGVGIFFTPATLARALPSARWVLGIWLLGGLASAAGALVFAELAARYPHAGGVYVFLREGFRGRAGPPMAFLYGWLQLLVVQPGSMAVIAIVLVDHAAHLTGSLSAGLRLGLALFAIAAFTLANLLGLRTGGRVQIGMAALKLAALALVIGVGLGWGDRAHLFAVRHEVPAGSWSSWMLLGLVPVLFSFGGAYHATYIGGSVRDPERSLPRGIVAGILFVLVGYVGVNLAYLSLLGHDGLAASTSPAADAAARALGPFAGKALALVIVLSGAGILNTACLGFPFVVYAMAKDGLFFERAGRLDARTGRPRVAVAVQGSLACVALLVGSSRVDLLLTGIAFADALFQAAVALVHLRVRRAPPPAPRMFRAPAAAAWIFLSVELGVAVGCLVRSPRQSAYGAIALLAGVGAWRLVGRAR
jgi:APA family basic amino acid/polyamine antiporter